MRSRVAPEDSMTPPQRTRQWESAQRAECRTDDIERRSIEARIFAPLLEG